MELSRTIETETGEMIVKRVSVPLGLEELMEGLAKEVILKKPKDIYIFAADYFTRLLRLRDSGLYRGNVRSAKLAVKQPFRATVLGHKVLSNSEPREKPGRKTPYPQKNDKISTNIHENRRAMIQNHLRKRHDIEVQSKQLPTRDTKSPTTRSKLPTRSRSLSKSSSDKIQNDNGNKQGEKTAVRKTSSGKENTTSKIPPRSRSTSTSSSARELREKKKMAAIKEKDSNICCTETLNKLSFKKISPENVELMNESECRNIQRSMSVTQDKDGHYEVLYRPTPLPTGQTENNVQSEITKNSSNEEKPSESDDVGKDEVKSAIAIQSLWRGRKERKRLKEISAKNSEFNSTIIQDIPNYQESSEENSKKKPEGETISLHDSENEEVKYSQKSTIENISPSKELMENKEEKSTMSDSRDISKDTQTKLDEESDLNESLKDSSVEEDKQDIQKTTIENTSPSKEIMENKAEKITMSDSRDISKDPQTKLDEESDLNESLKDSSVEEDKQDIQKSTIENTSPSKEIMENKEEKSTMSDSRDLSKDTQTKLDKESDLNESLKDSSVEEDKQDIQKSTIEDTTPSKEIMENKEQKSTMSDSRDISKDTQTKLDEESGLNESLKDSSVEEDKQDIQKSTIEDATPSKEIMENKEEKSTMSDSRDISKDTQTKLDEESYLNESLKDGSVEEDKEERNDASMIKKDEDFGEYTNVNNDNIRDIEKSYHRSDTIEVSSDVPLNAVEISEKDTLHDINSSAFQEEDPTNLSGDNSLNSKESIEEEDAKTTVDCNIFPINTSAEKNELSAEREPQEAVEHAEKVDHVTEESTSEHKNEEIRNTATENSEQTETKNEDLNKDSSEMHVPSEIGGDPIETKFERSKSHSHLSKSNSIEQGDDGSLRKTQSRNNEISTRRKRSIPSTSATVFIVENDEKGLDDSVSKSPETEFNEEAKKQDEIDKSGTKTQASEEQISEGASENNTTTKEKGVTQNDDMNGQTSENHMKQETSDDDEKNKSINVKGDSQIETEEEISAHQNSGNGGDNETQNSSSGGKSETPEKALDLDEGKSMNESEKIEKTSTTKNEASEKTMHTEPSSKMETPTSISEENASKSADTHEEKIEKLDEIDDAIMNDNETVKDEDTSLYSESLKNNTYDEMTSDEHETAQTNMKSESKSSGNETSMSHLDHSTTKSNSSDHEATMPNDTEKGGNEDSTLDTPEFSEQNTEKFIEKQEEAVHSTENLQNSQSQNELSKDSEASDLTKTIEKNESKVTDPSKTDNFSGLVSTSVNEPSMDLQNNSTMNSNISDPEEIIPNFNKKEEEKPRSRDENISRDSSGETTEKLSEQQDVSEKNEDIESKNLSTTKGILKSEENGEANVSSKNSDCNSSNSKCNSTDFSHSKSSGEPMPVQEISSTKSNVGNLENTPISSGNVEGKNKQKVQEGSNKDIQRDPHYEESVESNDNVNKDVDSIINDKEMIYESESTPVSDNHTETEKVESETLDSGKSLAEENGKIKDEDENFFNEDERIKVDSNEIRQNKQDGIEIKSNADLAQSSENKEQDANEIEESDENKKNKNGDNINSSEKKFDESERQSAVRIQTIWRGFQARKNLKALLEHKLKNPEHNLIISKKPSEDSIKDENENFPEAKNNNISNTDSETVKEPPIENEEKTELLMNNENNENSEDTTAPDLQNTQSSSSHEIEAAVKIQTAFRRYKKQHSSHEIDSQGTSSNKNEKYGDVTTKEQAESEELKDPEKYTNEEITAAKKIQTSFRKHYYEQENPNLNSTVMKRDQSKLESAGENSSVENMDTSSPEKIKSAIKIQASFRKSRKQRLKPRLEDMDLNSEMGKEYLKEVLKIQSAWRAYKVRKNIRDVERKISTIENMSGDNSEKSIHLTDQEILKAVTKIQAGLRGYITRKHFNNIREQNDALDRIKEESSSDYSRMSSTSSTDEQLLEILKQVEGATIPDTVPEIRSDEDPTPVSQEVSSIQAYPTRSESVEDLDSSDTIDDDKNKNEEGEMKIKDSKSSEAEEIPPEKSQRDSGEGKRSQQLVVEQETPTNSQEETIQSSLNCQEDIDENPEKMKNDLMDKSEQDNQSKSVSEIDNFKKEINPVSSSIGRPDGVESEDSFKNSQTEYTKVVESSSPEKISDKKSDGDLKTKNGIKLSNSAEISNLSADVEPSVKDSDKSQNDQDIKDEKDSEKSENHSVKGTLKKSKAIDNLVELAETYENKEEPSTFVEKTDDESKKKTSEMPSGNDTNGEDSLNEESGKKLAVFEIPDGFEPDGLEDGRTSKNSDVANEEITPEMKNSISDVPESKIDEEHTPKSEEPDAETTNKSNEEIFKAPTHEFPKHAEPPGKIEEEMQKTNYINTCIDGSNCHISKENTKTDMKDQNTTHSVNSSEEQGSKRPTLTDFMNKTLNPNPEIEAPKSSGVVATKVAPIKEDKPEKPYRSRYESATKIQSVFRGYLARKFVENLRTSHASTREKKENDALKQEERKDYSSEEIGNGSNEKKLKPETLNAQGTQTNISAEEDGNVNQDGSQVPAGAEILTTDAQHPVQPDEASGDVASVAQTSFSDAAASTQDALSNKSGAESECGMETAKRNNSTLRNKNMEAEAATKIQAGFRGYKVRKQLKMKDLSSGDVTKKTVRRKSSSCLTENQAKKQKENIDLQEKSAVKIQAGIRGFLVRKKVKKPQKSQE